MSTRTNLKGFIHEELFSLDAACRPAFRYALPDDRLRNAFSANGYPLGNEISLLPGSTSRKWKLVDGRKSYLVKDLGDRLVVILEKHPRLCRMLEVALYESKPRYYTLRWKLRRWRQQRVWGLKKRLVDRPGKLLVNLGAGVWYAPGWKVLECQGDWYRYAQSYIDYEHDLTSNRALPFADGSVHMFYSEHVFEHFRDEWCEHIIREAYRSLEEGGYFRIVVPDADLIYDRLLQKDAKFFQSWMERDNSTLAEAFRTLVGRATAPFDEGDFYRRLATMPKQDFLDWCRAGLEYDWTRTGEHINWFNFEKMQRMLKEAHFREVRRCEAQDSRVPEARGPGFDTRAWYSLHVECVK
jgi:predicted SAM-dependent methyltransferase